MEFVVSNPVSATSTTSVTSVVRKMTRQSLHKRIDRQISQFEVLLKGPN